MGMRIIQQGRRTYRRELERLRDRLRGGEVASGAAGRGVAATVAGIIADVRRRGDRALVEYAARFDKADLRRKGLRVPRAAIRRAAAACDGKFVKLVKRAIANVRRYQERIRIRSAPTLRKAGRELGVRYTPVDRVGVYVPGGRAFYPSTVLMTVVPAQAAGVREIAIASPPSAGGEVSPMVLALAAELKVSEVYRAGGAQAIAALAIGTGTIRPVDKVVGPGNAYVAEAKRQLFGLVGIDSIAGPSEVLIIADGTARADWVAADMLAQAEHDPGCAILVTTSRSLAREVGSLIDSMLVGLPRRQAARAAIEKNGAVVVVRNLAQAARVADALAPEHLQIMTADDEAVLAMVRHAGAIFVGPYTPVPLGDYYAGPSHVLPTGTTARFFSAFSCNDFLKASSVIRYDAEALAADAADVIEFAEREGLTAHAEAVRLRIGD